MCCCEKPNVNGEMGYKWQPNHAPSIRPVDPPVLFEGEVLLYDLPGRCGGRMDSHCHHYRIAKWLSSVYILAKHGGGEERKRLSTTPALMEMLEKITDTERYWLCNALYHAIDDARRQSAENEREWWKRAAAEKRIKTRKIRNRGVRVWVEPKPVTTEEVETCVTQ